MTGPFHPQQLAGGHVLGQQEARRKAFIAQQISQLSSAIYARAAGDRLQHPSPPDSDASFEELAQRCHKAAMAYFRGLGVIEKD